MSYFAYAFTGRLAIHKVGRYTYRVVHLDPSLEAALPFEGQPRLRMEGEIADLPIRAAWQPSGGGGHYVMVSPDLCREAGLAVGDEVEVRFNLADPSAVAVPEELAAALRRDRAADAVWQGLTPGRRRGFAHLVGSARTEATRLKRAADVALRLKEGRLELGKERRKTVPARSLVT